MLKRGGLKSKIQANLSKRAGSSIKEELCAKEEKKIDCKKRPFDRRKWELQREGELIAGKQAVRNVSERPAVHILKRSREGRGEPMIARGLFKRRNGKNWSQQKA